jgi:GTPase SAR1 family protein
MSCIENIMNFDEESLKTTEISQLGFSSSLVEDIKKVWKDEAIQQAFNRSSEFQLCDSAEYFFNQIDRICQENYIPTKEDILRVRAKTTGINEIEFKIDDFLFGMTDVGGQRSERRKWIHCFEDVTAIIFCVALSEYDQKLFEDENTNRMSESLKLFSDITNAKWFFNTPIILFLNKKDIFKRKIQKIPLSVCFGDYKGENTFEDASNFIEQKFKSLVQNPKKLVYVYKTCATDTNNVQRVFKTIKEVFIARYLEQIGFLGDQSMNSNNARPRGKSFSNSPTEITTK